MDVIHVAALLAHVKITVLVVALIVNNVVVKIAHVNPAVMIIVVKNKKTLLTRAFLSTVQSTIPWVLISIFFTSLKHIS